MDFLLLPWKCKISLNLIFLQVTSGPISLLAPTTHPPALLASSEFKQLPQNQDEHWVCRTKKKKRELQVILIPGYLLLSWSDQYKKVSSEDFSVSFLCSPADTMLRGGPTRQARRTVVQQELNRQSKAGERIDTKGQIEKEKSLFPVFPQVTRNT